MNILFLCIYPINVPLHGGQHRASNIVKTYKGLGHSVKVVGVLGSSLYPAEEGFEPSPPTIEYLSYINDSSLMEDWALSWLFSKNDTYFHALRKRIIETPDVIQIEQPWLFPFALRLRNEGYIPKCTKLLYSSQNIEFQLKHQIVKQFRGSNTADKYSELVKNMELSAFSNADAITAVSKQDKEVIEQYCDTPVVVAANGVAAWTTGRSDIDDANHYVRNQRYALFCGSAHPPNIKGFFDIFSGGVGCFLPDQKLVLVGGASDFIVNNQEFGRSAGLQKCVVSAGAIKQNVLHGLLECAHCIILPITEGGGTNLKTAEALWAGHYIVATSIAMRGFEQFKDEDGVFIADTSTAFKQILRHVMNLPALVVTEESRKRRQKVLWRHLLQPMVELAENLCEECVV
ncbi:glycosyltransferase [Legionella lytica]|uniref:Glycosyltransferase n=1 Tax=Legionella lytica TaxID=96232 RepID=A0ABW8DEH2_9GAMM